MDFWLPQDYDKYVGFMIMLFVVSYVVCFFIFKLMYRAVRRIKLPYYGLFLALYIFLLFLTVVAARIIDKGINFYPLPVMDGPDISPFMVYLFGVFFAVLTAWWRKERDPQVAEPTELNHDTEQ